MNKKLFLWVLLSLAVLSEVTAQYWQQEIDYFIEVKLDVNQKNLEAYQVISYQNNSPDDLSFIYFHVYPNSHANKQTAFAKQLLQNQSLRFQKAKPGDLGWIDQLDFQKLSVFEPSTDSLKELSGVKLPWTFTEHHDIVKVDLSQQPLKSGDKIFIYTPFKVKLPKAYSRMGAGEQVFHLSQWYPKPAVYDAKGWHPMPYLDQGEFYGEFANYYVHIEIPKSYTVLGTGQVDQEEEQRMKSLAYGQELIDSIGYKKVSYVAERVHDFAWFVSNQWHLNYFLLEREKSHSIDVWMATLNPDLWKNVPQYVEQTVRFLDQAVGTYPYSQISIVEGDLLAGAGMEYPMVSLIQKGLSGQSLEEVVVHEVAHNWFYGILANNERAFPWMDESLNSFYEQKIISSQSESKEKNQEEHISNILIRSQSKTKNSQAITSHSEEFTDLNYGVDLYMRAPMMIQYLEAYLGQEQFQNMMQSYFEEWKFKHPYPEDLRKHWSERVNKDIQWFFEWLEQPFLGDVEIKKMSSQRLKIANNTGVSNFPIAYFNAHDSMIHWIQFSGQDTVISVQDYQDKRWALMESLIDDKVNNNVTVNQWAVRPIAGLNLKNRKVIYAFPTLGINSHDGFMLGLGWHNYTIEPKSFEFSWMPFYSFKSKSWTGQGNISYNIWGANNFAQSVMLGLKGASYHFWDFERNNNNFFQRFIKLAPYVQVDFNQKNPRSLWAHQMSLQFDYIKEQSFNYSWSEESESFIPEGKYWEDESYISLSYDVKYNGILSPAQFGLKAQGNHKLVKLSAEVNWEIPYLYKKQSAKIRGFAGWMWYDQSKLAYLPLKYHWATTYTSVHDFTYEETFWARNEHRSFAQQQISIQDGGFKTLSAQYHQPIGISSSWLTALNLSFDIPKLNIPLRIYADLSVYPDQVLDHKIHSSYAIGLELYASSFLSVYFPLILSEDFKEYKKFFLAGSYGRTISLKFNLNEFQIPRLRKSIFN